MKEMKMEEEIFNQLEIELNELEKDGKLTDDNREGILKIAMKLHSKEDRKEYYDSLPVIAEVDESRLSPKELMRKIEGEIDELIREGAKIDKEKTLKVAMKFNKIEREEYYVSLFPARKKRLEEIEEKFKEEDEEKKKEEKKEVRGITGKTLMFIKKLKDAVW